MLALGVSAAVEAWDPSTKGDQSMGDPSLTNGLSGAPGVLPAVAAGVLPAEAVGLRALLA